LIIGRIEFPPVARSIRVYAGGRESLASWQGWTLASCYQADGWTVRDTIPIESPTVRT
jgi:hypothetical protein